MWALNYPSGLASRVACGLVFALAVLWAVTGCGSPSDPLQAARQAMPFHVRVPARSALPAAVGPTPLVYVHKDRIPSLVPTSGPPAYAYSVAIFYDYRAGQEPADLDHVAALSITEYQNPGGETRLIAYPTGGQHSNLDGRAVVVGRNPNLSGVEIVWVQDRVGLDMRSTLPWADTVRVFRSMTASASPTSAGTPTAASG